MGRVYASATPHEIILGDVSPTETVETCRDLLLSAVAKCRAKGNAQPDCLERCPILAVDSSVFSEESTLIQSSDNPDNIAQTVATQTSHWLGLIGAIEDNGCLDGPISVPYNWGEIDGEPATGFGYKCSITNK